MAYLPAEERKQSIINAAKRVIVRDGFGKLTIRSVVEEASVSMGLVHHYFKSTSELKREALCQYNQRFCAEYELDRHRFSPLENIKRLFADLIHDDKALYHKLWLEVWLEAQTDPLIGEAFHEISQYFHDAIVYEIRRGMEAGITEETTEEVMSHCAWRLISLSLGMGTLSNHHINQLSVSDARKQMKWEIEKTLGVNSAR